MAEPLFPQDETTPEAQPTGPGLWQEVTTFIRELVLTVVPAVLMAVVIHLFLAQSTIVYGQSMEPNLLEEQRLLVEKLTYRLHEPQRGDIVILENACRGTVPLIKRVVALPGETVTIADGRVFINKVELAEPYLPHATSGVDGSWRVPDGYVFVMGDNRAASCDSRTFGPVPIDSIMGHAIFRYWPLEEAGLLP